VKPGELILAVVGNKNLNEVLHFKNTCVLVLNPETLKCEAITRQIYRGAEKSLARPGRKQATATKL